MAAGITISQRETESVFRPALVLMTGRGLAFVATFFIPVILTRIFNPAEFGTYKQLFLIHSTIYFIAQFGMASSLFYFLPRAPRNAGRYAANSTLFVGAVGLACLALLIAGQSAFSEWLSNPKLAGYMPSVGLYLFLTMFSSALEMIMISRGRYLWASASYALTDLARAAALILPALLFGRLEWLLYGAVAMAALRAVATVIYFRREFPGSFRPDRDLAKSQLAYALPFGLAVLVEILQANLPYYAVSHRFDPATFAIYAIGCLQIPLVDFAASPTSDVMMVKMQERLAAGRKAAVLEIWHDTTRKLALLFFPLVALLVAASHEIIVFLFTDRYAASVPIFIVWSLVILLATIQTDGVMRVYAQMRFLLALNLVRLGIIAGLLQWSISTFFLLGPVLVTLLATVAAKTLALARMKKLLRIPIADLLPWKSLAAVLGAAGAAMAAALAVRSQLHASVVSLLFATAFVYGSLYVALLWRFNILDPGEKETLAAWVEKAVANTARVANLGKA